MSINSNSNKTLSKSQAHQRTLALNMNIDDTDDDSSSSKRVSPHHTTNDSHSTSGAGPAAASVSASSSEGKHDNSFLQPGKLRDANMVLCGAPGYNPRTVHVPPALLQKMTPAQRQYWEIKSKNFDTVLFFKIGKFYEMFDGDAEIGVRELGLNYMVNSIRPHAGFPKQRMRSMHLC